AGQAPEIVRLGDKVGLAVQLNHRADPASRVDVGFDQSLVRGTVGSLLRSRGSLLTEDLDGLVHVPSRLGEGSLTVHHSHAGLVAQFFNFIRCNVHSVLSHRVRQFLLYASCIISSRCGTSCPSRRAVDRSSPSLMASAINFVIPWIDLMASSFAG